jgi:drug/metabolite transporter (DMT)-like permease
VCIGLTMACTVLGATLLLGENIGFSRLIGIMFVFGGIWLTTRS